jgi:hypothetical protein
MIGPTDLLHPSPTLHFKTFQVFLIYCTKRPIFRFDWIKFLFSQRYFIFISIIYSCLGPVFLPFFFTESNSVSVSLRVVSELSLLDKHETKLKPSNQNFKFLTLTKARTIKLCKTSVPFSNKTHRKSRTSIGWSFMGKMAVYRENN